MGLAKGQIKAAVTEKWSLNGVQKALLIAIAFCMVAIGVLVFLSSFAHADGTSTWTPLVAASDFTGMKTDVQTAAVGVLSVLLIIVGIGVIVKVLG